MEGFDEATYGDRVANRYDDWYPSDPFGEGESEIAFLADAAVGGPALELGIGTGRVAVPLAATGLTVEGIDASQAMVDRLRAKDAGIEVTIGSFAEFSLGRRFSLIYIVFNTFFALTTRAAQMSCMRSAAQHLAPGGVFVMTAFVPDPARFDRGQRVGVFQVGVDEVTLETSKVDPHDDHVIDSAYVILHDGEPVHVAPVRIRYAYPIELDQLADEGGLRLRERWADWDRSAFDSTSARHVSVWERK